ncbi:hypothetical protein [Myxococcus sp. CA039A]|uniref:hypothetical protein n=1 Tax=Myxococcus sp. CA039A TaxID=2741737 RepID=UPI00157B23E0|nr:hypothetical protein [Myxococcus sp. CA039A]NTX54044.1 hypothetical protein [Myxococcus sp. CA039A]
MMRKLVAGGAMMIALTTGLLATTLVQSPLGGATAFTDAPSVLTSREEARTLGRCSVDLSPCFNTAECRVRGMGNCLYED